LLAFNESRYKILIYSYPHTEKKDHKPITNQKINGERPERQSTEKSHITGKSNREINEYAKEKDKESSEVNQTSLPVIL
jgi:hypothetical protein